jgi:hypothetical protein
MTSKRRGQVDARRLDIARQANLKEVAVDSRQRAISDEGILSTHASLCLLIPHDILSKTMYIHHYWKA